MHHFLTQKKYNKMAMIWYESEAVEIINFISAVLGILSSVVSVGTYLYQKYNAPIHACSSSCCSRYSKDLSYIEVDNSAVEDSHIVHIDYSDNLMI